jgi:hypothetical protein
VGHAASGRNGGFVAASLTHGLPNGLERWPEQIGELLRLGRGESRVDRPNTITTEGIDCDLQRSGEINVAVADYQVEDLAELARHRRDLGLDLQLLDTDQVRSRLNSPTYLAGLSSTRMTVVMVDPARLAWGLAAACERKRSADLREHPGPLPGADRRRGARRDRSWACACRARGPRDERLPAVAVPSRPLRRGGLRLRAGHRAALRRAAGIHRLAGREGFADAGNQFHYYRITEDGRILWGGYDASYYGDMGPHRENNEEAFARLAEHFTQTFPQLSGWGSRTLGGGHRHLLALQCFLGHGDAGQGRLFAGLHRAWCRSLAVSVPR